MDFHGKRLLILGCSNNANDIKKFAEKSNVKIILAGLSFSMSMREIADEIYTFDITDSKELYDFLSQGIVDGVFVGGNEDIITAVVGVLEELGYPFYTSKSLWDIASDKSAFKTVCKKNGVPVTRDYKIAEDGTYNENDLSFPLVLKPVDGCGSRGVMLCHTKDVLKESIHVARGHSKNGRILAEEYIDGEEVVVYYTFCDGQVSLSSMCDRYNRTDGDSFNSLPDLWAYPSKYLDEYCNQIDNNMRKMLLELGVRNGIVGVQGFYYKKQFLFFEIGFRLGGTAQYRYTLECNGISSFEMMMNYALTGKMSGYDQALDTPYFKKKCCTVTLMNRGGTIKRIEGLNDVEKRKEVLIVEKRYTVGDTVQITHSLGQMQYWIFIITDTVDEMKDIINFVQRTIKVYDTNEQMMLTTVFDTERLMF